jgi:hypothetical protein
VEKPTPDLLPENEERKLRLKAIGRAYAPLFAAFSGRILELAREQKLTDAWFFTREGFFFKAVFESFQRGLGDIAVQPRLLHVSRLATFAASLTPPLEQSLQRLWSQYSTQSIENLFSSLGIPPDAFEKAISAQGLRLQSPAKALNFEDVALRAPLERAVLAKEASLRQYLQETGFPESGAALVVDIGWRGTIQDNLAHLLPEVLFSGAYLGLLPRLNKEPSNVTKAALIADLQLDDSLQSRQRLTHSLPFEMLCNGQGGSVKGYHEGKPTLELNQEEDRVFQSFTRYVQAGVLEEVYQLGVAVREGALTRERLRIEGLAVWDTILRNPAPALIEAVLTLEHNETFGVGQHIRYGAGITWKLLLSSLTNRSARERLVVESIGLPWKKQLRTHPGVSAALKTWLTVEPAVKVVRKVLKKLKSGIVL